MNDRFYRIYCLFHWWMNMNFFTKRPVKFQNNKMRKFHGCQSPRDPFIAVVYWGDYLISIPNLGETFTTQLPLTIPSLRIWSSPSIRDGDPKQHSVEFWGGREERAVIAVEAENSVRWVHLDHGVLNPNRKGSVLCSLYVYSPNTPISFICNVLCLCSAQSRGNRPQQGARQLNILWWAGVIENISAWIFGKQIDGIYGSVTPYQLGFYLVHMSFQRFESPW